MTEDTIMIPIMLLTVKRAVQLVLFLPFLVFEEETSFNYQRLVVEQSG